ncbi:hypothetical protein PEBR_34934 [Penicillium brasilianum]|uniref:Uncharacterized protein n=1 Tax=Penicillium brasilianum TaxID=104259 RepID=A0A1S9RDK3_PENBI|nr:hypothetical protein PEBR_34934 [Penicillium brasilianum]
MATRTHSFAPPTTANTFTSYSQSIPRAMTTPATSKPTKFSHGLVDGMPPAPPPSPVSFAIDSTGGTIPHMEKIVRLSLE